MASPSPDSTRTRPARACLDCGRITTHYANGRCVGCARRHLTERERAREQDRGTRTQRGYTNAWRRLVERAITQHPYCAVCQHPGSPDNPLTGDHLVPLSKGGTSTADNLVVLCRVHNSAKGDRVWVGRGGGRVAETAMVRRGEEVRR